MFKIFITLFSTAIILLGLSTPAMVSAVDVSKNVCDLNNQAKSESVYCKDSDLNGKNPIFGPNGLMTKIISILSIIVGIAAVIGVMLAGLKFITGGNNPQEIASARNLLIFAIVAVLVALSSQLIIRVFLYQIGD